MNSSRIELDDPCSNPRTWPIRKFGSLVDEFRYGTSNKSDDAGLPALRIPNVVGGVLNLNDLKCVPVSAADEARLRLIDDDLLFVRTNGNPDYVGRCALFSEKAVSTSAFPTDRFIYASYLIRARLRSEEVEPAFMREFMLSPAGRAQLKACGRTSAGQYNINIEGLSSIHVPVPPIGDQQAIVDVLQRAEDVRRSRRKCVALLDQLSESVFFDMFGDPRGNPRGLSVMRFGDMLKEAPRNGLSPSYGAPVMSKVLTLSAITGPRFDESAFKISTFKAIPPASQSVSSHDFLICRGNGNIQLVGRGFFPAEDMSDTTFPDTMIAARVDRSLLTSEYVEHVWRTRAIRRQIESSARTTNGTFKINQKSVESVQVMVPPMDEQRRFASRVHQISQVKTYYSGHLRALDDLFASLQHRAFNGELARPEDT